MRSTDGEPLPPALELVESDEGNDVATELNGRLGWWRVREQFTLESKKIVGHPSG